MVSALVGQRYPAYASELRAFIADFQVAHRSEPDVEQRVADAIWEEPRFKFLHLSADAFQDVWDDASEHSGALTPAKRDALRAYIDVAQEYEKELQELADAEVARRYDEAASAAQRDAAVLRHECGLQADAQAFFNKPAAAAEYSYWHQRAVWTAEEATALSFGKDPRRVNIETLEALGPLTSSPFRDEFRERSDIIGRAFQADAFKPSIIPKAFVTWARRSQLGVDSSLITALLPPKAKSSSVTNRDSIGKNRTHHIYEYIVGMAIVKYKLDITLPPEAEQLAVYGPMHRDLAKVGVSISEPTLRGIVREAMSWAHEVGHCSIEEAKRKRPTRSGAPPTTAAKK